MSADAGELPRRKHTAFEIRRKFEIKKASMMSYTYIACLVMCYLPKIQDRKSEETVRTVVN